MNKIKILYIVSSLKKCAPTQQLFNIVKHLDQDQFQCKILTLSPEPGKTQIEDFKKLNVEIDSLNLNRIHFVITGYQHLKDYIKRTKPDIIHSSGIRADFFVSKLNLPIKHCLSVRNYAYEDYSLRYGKLIGFVSAKIHLHVMSHSEYPIFCSFALKKRYQLILSNQLYAVQDGIDIQKFLPLNDSESKVQIRKRLELPEDKYIFIVSGHLSSIKDPETIIKAFSMIENKNAQLIFIGKGHLFKQLLKKQLNNITFLGYVENVADYLKASDCFISASISEGMGNSVIEAAACGLELILSEIPSHREICGSFAQAHTFFSIRDYEQLSQLMTHKIKNQLIKESEEFMTYIHNNFSAFNMSQNYQKIYTQMIVKAVNSQ